MPERPALDEFALIEALFAPLAAGEPGALGLEDDAALIAPRAGHRLVVTTDLLVEGVHFLAGDPAGEVARKLLRVNLSDLAAMGARPRGYLLGVALPAGRETAWLAAFAAGLADDQERFSIRLLGGDTTATTGPVCLALTALGEVADGRALLRSGAAPGEDVYVSGTVGDAALGLRVLKGEDLGIGPAACAALVGRYRLPEPRTALGPALAGIATAAIDVSDGLAADLGHICETSGVGAEIEAAAVPLSEAAAAALARDGGLIADVLGGGDDYELLVTAKPDAAAAVAAAASAAGVPLARIGRIVAEPGVRVRDRAGRPIALKRAGYRHFSEDPGA